MSKYISLLLNECIDVLNEEIVCPTYHYCLSRAALKSIYKINLCESINICDDLFIKYSQTGINDLIRNTALICLIKKLNIPCHSSLLILEFLIDLILNDPSFFVKENILFNLSKYPPIKLVVIFIFILIFIANKSIC